MRQTALHRPLLPRLFRAALLGALVFWPGVAPAQVESTEGRFVQGLRQRQLFALAEAYCQKRLIDGRLPVDDRADLVVHLSQTLADHARQTPPEQADALWDKAFAATEDFVREQPQGTWPLLVRVQGALVLSGRGELLRQRAEVTGDNQRLLEQSKDFLRRAIKDLRGQAADVTAALRKPPSKDQLTRNELLSLEKNVKFQLAVAYRNQALCYAADSADRDNALRQALEQLSTLASMSTVDSLAWQARLEEITCHRLMGQQALAVRRLTALEAEQPPAQVLLRARAERVRLHLAAGQMSEALKVLEAGRQIDGQIDADLDFAHVEVYLAAWRAANKANDKPTADKWQEQAVNAVRGIEQLHPPYWARRAESLLASVISDVGATGNLAVLARAAQGFYRAKQLDDALRAYDQAAAAARQQKQPDQAFDLAYTAATIEHDRKNHTAAKERYRKLALEQPKHAQAGEAHLLAVYNAAQEARQQQPLKLDEYASLLREHLATWPEGATAHQARWTLGQYYQYERRWSDAIAAYRAIAADHERFTQAVPAIARCYDAVLAEARAGNKPTATLASEAAAYFERLVLPGEKPQWPQRWSPTERLAAVAACRFRLDSLTSDPQKDANTAGRVEQFLTAALSGQPDPPADWKPSAQSLLVVALAAQGQWDRAGPIIDELTAAPSAELLSLVQRLASVSKSANPEKQQALGKLQSQVAELLAKRRSELGPDGQRSFDLLRAKATAAGGDYKSAVAQFEPLAKAFPRDGEIQEALASTLLDAGDRASLQAALAKWREIERNSRQASPRWFRAKYHLALAYERLGERARAAETIKVVQVLHPELGGPELKGRFLELLKRVEK
jgi:hypothetical protein